MIDLSMGKHGVYVWSCYGIFMLSCMVFWLDSLRARKSAKTLIQKMRRKS